jgi:hypothetical protein
MRSTDIKIGEEYAIAKRAEAFGKPSGGDRTRAKVLGKVTAINRHGHPRNIEIEYTDDKLPTLEAWEASQTEYVAKNIASQRLLFAKPTKAEREQAELEVENPDYRLKQGYGPKWKGQITRVYSGLIVETWTEKEEREVERKQRMADHAQVKKENHEKCLERLQRAGATDEQIAMLTKDGLEDLYSGRHFYLDLDDVLNLLGGEE